MRPVEAVPALFMLVLAAAVYFGTTGLNYWDGPTPGARFFPAILAVAATMVALLLLLAQWRGIERLEIHALSLVGLLRVGASFAALVALAAGIPVLGFVPVLGAFVLAMLFVVLRRPILPSLFAAVIVAGFVHLVFVRWLSVPLPMPLGI
ncbi:MAG: tripartite tricarboxylate transporter TctB family protein [Salinarimonas sp.]